MTQYDSVLDELGLDLAPLLEALPGAALIFDEDLKILWQSQKHAQMTHTERNSVIGQYMFDAFPPGPSEGAVSAERAIKASKEKVFASGLRDVLPIQEHALEHPSGQWQSHYWQVQHLPIANEGRTIAILQLAEDVTRNVREREYSRAQRLASESAAAVSYFAFDPATDQFWRSSYVDELFGFKQDEAGAYASPFFELIFEEDLAEVQAELERIANAKNGTLAQFDYRIRQKRTNLIKYIRARGEMVIDPDDGVRKLVGVFIDMTDTEARNTELANALQVKEDLLIEVNHRVKNSLQLVSSIMRLQAARVDDPELRRLLDLANSRVRAIAEVHSSLYLGGDVTKVDAKDLLGNLIKAMQHTVSSEETPIDIKAKIDPFELPTDLAIALGLFVNELLTNALKYSLRTSGSEIIFTVNVLGSSVELELSNPVNSSPAADSSSTGIGSQLMSGFARQLKAKVETQSDDGRYRAAIRFDLPTERRIKS